jgi:tRNA (Thr-GGU) A37 N-methylase
MKIELTPIGFVKTSIKNIPRHWTISDVEGRIVIDKKYKEGLRDIKAGQRIKNINAISAFHMQKMHLLKNIYSQTL